MIRATYMTDKGPLLFVGLDDGNLRRLRAGMPLVIDIKEMTPPGTRINKAVVHLGHTYEEVVDDWAKGGLPVMPELYAEARKLDAEEGK